MTLQKQQAPKDDINLAPSETATPAPFRAPDSIEAAMPSHSNYNTNNKIYVGNCWDIIFSENKNLLLHNLTKGL